MAKGNYTNVNVGLISVPTYDYAVSQGEGYCSRLYCDINTITGMMDRAGSGGTDEWWKLDDLATELAEYLCLED